MPHPGDDLRLDFSIVVVEALEWQEERRRLPTLDRVVGTGRQPVDVALEPVAPAGGPVAAESQPRAGDEADDRRICGGFSRVARREP